MTWKAVLEARRVVREPPARAELAALQELAAHALADASIEAVSDDGRFGRAYSAARALATTVICASGCRVRSSAGGHYYTFVALEAADRSRFGAFAASAGPTSRVAMVFPGKSPRFGPRLRPVAYSLASIPVRLWPWCP